MRYIYRPDNDGVDMTKIMKIAGGFQLPSVCLVASFSALNFQNCNLQLSYTNKNCQLLVKKEKKFSNFNV